MKWDNLWRAERALRKVRKPEHRARLRKAIDDAKAYKPEMLIIERKLVTRVPGGLSFATHANLRTETNESAKRRYRLDLELRLAMRPIKGTVANARYRAALAAKREARALADRTCPACRKSFTPKRRDAVTCSNRCRQALFRAKATQ
jgi:hypothetical protein